MSFSTPALLVTTALGVGASLSTTTPTRASTDTAASEDHPKMLLTDFSDPAVNQRWRVVNDNVMGGQSEGNLSFETSDDDTSILVMTGNINTNGGGFTSVRMILDPTRDTENDEVPATELPDFSDAKAIRLRVRAERQSLGKPFALRLEDNVRRRLGINFRAQLPMNPELPPEVWQTVELAMNELEPTHRGRRLDPVEWEPLDPSRVNRLGIILNNVGDGPYRLEVERIELLY